MHFNSVVSGFYAECPGKKMYCNGYIYTKSRFLGLSLGVHNIGEVILHLLEHDDEQYVVTLPSAYGRLVCVGDCCVYSISIWFTL